MQIAAPFTGVSSKTDIQIQNSISHLLVVMVGAAFITDEKITLSLKTTGGKSLNVIPITKLRRPAVISQFGQGYQLEQILPNGDHKTAYLISLSDYGAIKLENNDYLSLDLSDLVDGSTYTIFGVQSPVVARAYNEYNSQVITGAESQNRAFTPDRATKGIAISNNGSLASIRLSYGNGVEVTYLPEELSAISRNGNDVSFSADKLIEGDSLSQTISGGGTELFWLPLSNCVRYEISTTGGVDLTLIQLIRKAY